MDLLSRSCRTCCSDLSCKLVATIVIPSTLSFKGWEWLGPVPDPEGFSPLEVPPAPSDVFVDLEKFDRLSSMAREAEEEEAEEEVVKKGRPDGEEK